GAGKVVFEENMVELDKSDNLKELLLKYHDKLFRNKLGNFEHERELEEKIFTLKIELSNSNPSIYRTIRVNNSMDLDLFSECLLKIMGWGGFHLSMFEYKKEREWVAINEEDYDFMFDDESDDEESDMESPLEDYLLDDFFKDKKSVLKYTYDFGDNWRHLITLQKVEKGQLKHQVECIEGKRATPMEDVGGIFTYEYMLEVLQDKSHEDYENYEGWTDED
ncbi:plasmid pRiA4b ORF-3 family protein, partial [Flammeovirga aprica]